MDVNGTRLHLVLGFDDWERAIEHPVDPRACYDPQRNTLGLRPAPFTFPRPTTGTSLVPADRRGAAADTNGNWYWISDDRRQIRVLGTGSTDPVTYWPDLDDPTPPPPGSFTACETPIPTTIELSGLTITADHYLIVGVVDLPVGNGTSAGLLVFDLPGGGPPVALTWPAELEVRPFDLAARPGGGAVVLDIADPDAPGAARLWYLDEQFRVVNLGGTDTALDLAPTFTACGPQPDAVPSTPTPSGLSGSTPDHAVALDTQWATAIDMLPDGTVLVLDREGPDGHLELSRWRCGERLDFAVNLDHVDEPELDLVCSDQGGNAHEILRDLHGHDLAVVAADSPEALAKAFVVDEHGHQAFAFRIHELGAELVTDHHPLRLFSGKALVALGDLAYYDLEERWFPIPTRMTPRFATEATVVLGPDDEGGSAGRGFDGNLPGTVWHRLLLDATIPSGASVEVETRTADDLAVLNHSEWHREPRPYLRSGPSEIPYHRYPDDGGCDGQGTWELLFQRAVGRYLQVRLTLRGDGRTTPRIWAARAHFPRHSYLTNYLPDIYQQDRESASFLDRYLANVEGMYTTFEGQILDIQRLVDPDTTDPDYLPWLASWVGGVVEPDWEPERVRLFVTYAARLFARRGTMRGLIEAIRLATDPCPSDEIFAGSHHADAFGVRVVEEFRTRRTPGVVFGDPTDLAGPSLVEPGERWTIADGRAALNARWESYLSARYAGGSSPHGSTTTFPALTPTEQPARSDWLDFTRRELAVTYATVGSPEDLVAYREFLRQQYRRIGALHTAWNLQSANKPTNFTDLNLPMSAPPDGPRLQDWITFVSSVLPIRRHAHRFAVLVPVHLDDSDERREQRLGRVRRIVDTDRPAHTQFDVRPYWATMRVGEARVGFETIVGEGSRYIDMIVGTGRLAYTALPGGRTWRLDSRHVVGRDRIEASAPVPAETGGT